MAHMLGMSASQVSHPITDLVLMKANNGLLHAFSYVRHETCLWRRYSFKPS